MGVGRKMWVNVGFIKEVVSEYGIRDGMVLEGRRKAGSTLERLAIKWALKVLIDFSTGLVRWL